MAFFKLSSNHNRIWLRRFSKLTCFSTLFLVFVGGMVTSTGSGLAVPDWPLSYGMLFPPMVGGVFYEHGHRLVALVVGFFMLILAVWLGIAERRRWVKNLGFLALGAVILQGILGGITVKFFLPTAVSVAHGVLAQTFFILTIIIAYSQSMERSKRIGHAELENNLAIKLSLLLVCFIYVQLIIGAVMRHTHSGLAIPDFPRMGGSFFPQFDTSMLKRINLWRFDNNLDPVTLGQVLIHFLHRLWAVAILGLTGFLAFYIVQSDSPMKNLKSTVFWMGHLIWVQVILGILSVMTQKAPVITSSHVAMGAALLGLSVVLSLRLSPLSIKRFIETI